ncbi:GGDEF domain-containing protein, partial [Acinetobacter seifertii]|uniref:diguanylate cyclase n=1 Tax=Acinetobacter seifertii TaxID=1530123 RepID=UPI0015806FFC
AVLFIDIDFFKNYNDFYGHQMGDKVISSIASAIKNSIRHVDFVARYGGEEFIVLLPETPAQGAYSVAANIYKAIERQAIPHAASLVSKYVTISLGFTVYAGGLKMGQDELIHAADQALYRAKQLGRNQIYYQPLQIVETA